MFPAGVIVLYSIFSDAAEAALLMALDAGVCRLPVSTIHVARHYGVNVVKYADAARLNALYSDAGTATPHDTNNARARSSGQAVSQGGVWYIIYNDAEPRRRCRFTIAHELGHIVLGHLIDDESAAPPPRTSTQRNSLHRDDNERAADTFAACLLMPAVILREARLLTPDAISRACDVSYTAALSRSRRIAEMEIRRVWHNSALEQALLKNYKNWLNSLRAP
jgi:hypothetical protein